MAVASCYKVAIRLYYISLFEIGSETLISLLPFISIIKSITLVYGSLHINKNTSYISSFLRDMVGTFKIRDLNPSPAPRGGPIKKVSIRCSSLG